MGALGSQRRGGGRLGSGDCRGIGPTIAIGLLALRANSLISKEVLPRVRETVCGCCCVPTRLLRRRPRAGHRLKL